MKQLCGFALALFCCACQNLEPGTGKWDGTYIGYMHQNQQDTLPLTLVFEGSRFSAEPGSKNRDIAANGVFYEQKSTLVFEDQASNGRMQLNGVYHYDYGVDGSLRIWQDNGQEYSELILLQK